MQPVVGPEEITGWAMSDTYIIEVGSQPAGIIVRAPGGYRFFAASHRFNRLEGQIFRNRARPSARPGVLPAGCRWRRNRQRPSFSGQSLVAARDSSFQSLPCFCQFIRMCRFCGVFLPSVNSCSPTKLKRTMAVGPTTRTVGSLYSSDVHL